MGWDREGWGSFAVSPGPGGRGGPGRAAHAPSSLRRLARWEAMNPPAPVMLIFSFFSGQYAEGPRPRSVPAARHEGGPGAGLRTLEGVLGELGDLVLGVGEPLGAAAPHAGPGSALVPARPGAVGWDPGRFSGRCSKSLFGPCGCHGRPGRAWLAGAGRTWGGLPGGLRPGLHSVPNKRP